MDEPADSESSDMFEEYHEGLEEIFAAMESIKQEIESMKEPMGRTKDNPGRSCNDIWLCHPDFPSGEDPMLTRGIYLIYLGCYNL